MEMVEVKLDEMKPCPFCGGEAHLVRTASCASYHPTRITDTWVVRCAKKCCETPIFKDDIYHKSDGLVVVEHNGAEEAINAWNTRA